MRILAVITALLSYIMLLMGAIVTKTGSGKGCGNSWPFCHGQLFPEELPVSTIIEYSHRIISGGVGFLILILTISSWIKYKENTCIKVLSFFSLFFVVLQGVLGALTVVFTASFAKKAALALHFGFSLISFASVVLLTICLIKKKKEPIVVSKHLRFSVWGVLIYTYAVIYTGALVRHTHATMGCGFKFPLCESASSFPHFSSLAGIHMFHRYAAISLWCCVLCLLIYILRHFDRGTRIRTASILAFVLITLQAMSGIWTVLSGGQILVALIHTTVISGFFAVLSYICMEMCFSRGQA